jgi:hypothetical protein
MARAAVSSAASAWQQRLRRYSRSGLSVTDFCSNEKVSVPSFYAWKKKLIAETSNPEGSPDGSSGPVFRAVSLVRNTPVISARLPGGLQFEVGVLDLEVVRTVVAELVRADHAAATGESPC